jgi:ADP-heptose:LPS heptosyltransferase
LKCLIISTNALGDAFLSCSAIEPLRKNFPGLELNMVANKSSGLFLPYLDIDNIYYLESKKIRDINSLLKSIKKIRYDITFCFFPGIINTYFYLKADSEKKSGFINFIKRNEWHDKNQKLTVKKNNNGGLIWTPDMNFLERIRITLEGAGILTGKLSKPKFDISIVKLKKEFILFHPYSRSSDKRLSREVILEVIETIKNSSGVPVYILCSSSDPVDEIRGPGLNFLQDLPLDKLLEYIVNCRLYIGVDSFPIHIADAYDKNILGLFSVTKPENVFQKQRDFVFIDSSPEEIISKLKEKLLPINDGH